MIFKRKLINKHYNCNIFTNLSDKIYFFFITAFLFFKIKLTLIYFLKEFKKLSLGWLFKSLFY